MKISLVLSLSLMTVSATSFKVEGYWFKRKPVVKETRTQIVVRKTKSLLNTKLFLCSASGVAGFLAHKMFEKYKSQAAAPRVHIHNG